MATTTAVMGAGAWGTALAKLLADAGSEVTLWARRSDVADEINSSRWNTGYLSGMKLPAGIRATADPAEALNGATTVLLAVPAQTASDTFLMSAFPSTTETWPLGPIAQYTVGLSSAGGWSGTRRGSWPP